MRHDELYKIIDDRICPKDYSAFSGVKNIAMVAIDEELRFDRCISKIREFAPDAIFYVIAHARMYGYISSKYPEMKVFEWKGKYTDEVAAAISDMLGETVPDAFLYFSEQEMNRRDSNLIRVAEMLEEKYGNRSFCNSIGDELYELKEVQVLNQAYKTYDEMCKLKYLLG